MAGTVTETGPVKRSESIGGAKVKKLAITTDGSTGAADGTVDIYGEILGVWVDKDDLSTPDVDLSDTVTGELFLTVNGVASDTMYHPKVLATTNAAAALTVTGNTYVNYFIGNCTIAITGAGNTKSGSIYIYYR